MTSFMDLPVECPHCGSSFQFSYLASVCTWISPQLIEKILEGHANVRACPHCNGAVVFDQPVLINSPSGMFWMSLTEDMDIKRKMLLENGVINEDNQVVNLDLKPKEDE
ncbi:MAG: CpXC domain-containing protein [Candidatus Thorarchaeota archaeon]